MLKPSELQIGDYARVNRDGLCIKKGTIVTIRGVDADNRLNSDIVGSAICRPLDDEQLQGGIWCEFLDPIPITPEILEKNGFSKDFDFVTKGYMSLVDVDGDNKFWILWCVKDRNLDAQRQNKELIERNWCATRVCIPCDYVHQLQQALRLLGIEKKIEL